jgi:hypothetical protein
MAFVFGLASVYLFNGSLNSTDEIRVNLPTAQSDSVIFIKPKKSICILPSGGHGIPNTKEFIAEWKSNCLVSNTANSK